MVFILRLEENISLFLKNVQLVFVLLQRDNISQAPQVSVSIAGAPQWEEEALANR